MEHPLGGAGIAVAFEAVTVVVGEAPAAFLPSKELDTPVIDAVTVVDKTPVDAKMLVVDLEYSLSSAQDMYPGKETLQLGDRTQTPLASQVGPMGVEVAGTVVVTTVCESWSNVVVAMLDARL